MKRALLLVMAAATCSGCFTLNARLPGALRADLDDGVTVVGHYDREVKHIYFLGGLFPPAPESIFADDLRRAVVEAGADGVANLRFDAQFTGFDMFVSSISLSVVAPRTYRVRADLVRIEAPPLPGAPVLQRGGP